MGAKWWALVVVCAATFWLLLDVTIVVVAFAAVEQGSAALAFVGAACALGLIRSRDFVVSQQPQQPSVPAVPVGT